MAYSDYGGYVFRNGVRIEERSDWTLTADGGFGTPGIWPGWALLLSGVSRDETLKVLEGPTFHAALGTGPIYVGLRKQSLAGIWRATEKLDELDLLAEESQSGKFFHEWEGKRYLDSDYFKASDLPCLFCVDGVKIEVRFTEEDNYYIYARVEEPDGTIWCGWSGYGVGAGLEDCGYGYSTSERNEMLLTFWPDAIRRE